VHVAVFPVGLALPGAGVAADLPYGIFAAPLHVRSGHAAPVRRHDGHMDVKRGNHVPAALVAAVNCRRPMACCGAVAIRDRLYPAAGQERVLVRHCDDARFVWNLAVEQQSWWRPGRGAAPGAAARQRQLAEARAAEPWLAEGSSSVQQQALRDFDRALAAFFDPGNPAGKPAFRGKRGSQGFVIRDTRVRRLSRRWGEVQVPKCG
jgi:hypothetical protein